MNKRVEKPSIYAAALAAIEQKHGRLTPTLVVQEARNEESPLHKEFTWDDSTAAVQWREQQAREIIRSARIEVTVNDISFSAIAYVHDPTLQPKEQGYRSIAHLSADRVASVEAVASELRAAAALLRRARDVAASLGVSVDEIQKLEESTGSLATSLSSTNQAANAA
jgi:hypothetical protein